MMYRYLIVLSAVLVTLQVEAQHFFEKSLNASFAEGAANQVVFIQIPVNVNIFGTIEIKITGGYNLQLNRGVLIKRI